MDLKHIEKHWLTSSIDDFDTAKILFEKEKYVQSMFFLHLSLEKMLKALYVNKNNGEAPFGHNLVKIASLIENLELGEYEKILLADVTSFNISSRYDDYKRNFFEICNADFANGYITNTEKLILWLKSLMKY